MVADQKIMERTSKEKASVGTRKGRKATPKFNHERGRIPQGKSRRAGVTRRKAIEVRLSPHWDQIEEVRRRTSSFLKNQGLSKEVIDALTMVSSELVENAVKYGCFEESDNGLTFRLHLADKSVIVEVSLSGDHKKGIAGVGEE